MITVVAGASITVSFTAMAWKPIDAASRHATIVIMDPSTSYASLIGSKSWRKTPKMRDPNSITFSSVKRTTLIKQGDDTSRLALNLTAIKAPIPDAIVNTALTAALVPTLSSNSGIAAALLANTILPVIEERNNLRESTVQRHGGGPFILVNGLGKPIVAAKYLIHRDE